MEKIRAIVVDDEKHARVLLIKMLEEFCEEVQVVDEAEDIPSCVKSIHKHKPDLIFLDIEMPGHSGLELLDFFGDEDPDFSVVFTTAYHQYAIRAFKLSAIDYLLKPIEPEELQEVVKRYKKIKGNIKSQLEYFRTLSSGAVNANVLVPTSSGLRFINMSDIVYITADNTYCEITLQNGRVLIASRTLKNFEDSLRDDPRFLRCHKSYIVNTNFVSEFVKADGGYLVMTDKKEIPITPDRSKELIDRNVLIKR